MVQGIVDSSNQVVVSVASSWKISIKYSLGKLTPPKPPDQYLAEQISIAGFELLLVDEPEVCQLHRLPAVHRDPFDRLLIAQANCYGMTLATDDSVFSRYPVRTLW